jgi:Ca2+-binding EF-hand superfamily protein
LERLQRTTLLFRGYDERQEGILSFSKLIDLLNDQQLQIDNELLLILSQYSQETRSTRRQPSQEELYELMLQGDDNLQITYSRFIDFAKKKFHRGKNLLDIINKRSE